MRASSAFGDASLASSSVYSARPRPSRHSAASPKLDDVVLRALEKDPARRYQRASEVKSDLESVEHGERPPLAATDSKPTEEDSAPKLWAQAVVSAVLSGLGCIPFLITVETPRRRSVTRVVTEDYDLRAQIPDRLFNTWNLEAGDARSDRRKTRGAAPVSAAGSRSDVHSGE